MAAMRYYKVTAPDGLSFQSGGQMKGVDYGSALGTGEVVSHPLQAGPGLKMTRNNPMTYLSIAVGSPAEAVGMRWPCRVFRVEPVGRVMTSDTYVHKRCVLKVRVVEELPSWSVFGDRGVLATQVLNLILTAHPHERDALISEWKEKRRVGPKGMNLKHNDRGVAPPEFIGGMYSVIPPRWPGMVAAYAAAGVALSQLNRSSGIEALDPRPRLSDPYFVQTVWHSTLGQAAYYGLLSLVYHDKIKRQRREALWSPWEHALAGAPPVSEQA